MDMKAGFHYWSNWNYVFMFRGSGRKGQAAAQAGALNLSAVSLFDAGLSHEKNGYEALQPAQRPCGRCVAFRCPPASCPCGRDCSTRGRH
jgi:hypothetical protein